METLKKAGESQREGEKEGGRWLTIELIYIYALTMDTDNGRWRTGMGQELGGGGNGDKKGDIYNTLDNKDFLKYYPWDWNTKYLFCWPQVKQKISFTRASHFHHSSSFKFVHGETDYSELVFILPEISYSWVF